MRCRYGGKSSGFQNRAAVKSSPSLSPALVRLWLEPGAGWNLLTQNIDLFLRGGLKCCLCHLKNHPTIPEISKRIQPHKSKKIVCHFFFLFSIAISARFPAFKYSHSLSPLFMPC